MNRWSLIALDMDGTLLNKQGAISEENRLAVKHAMEVGIEVTIATGRHIKNILPFAEELGLKAPLVTTNGSEVWTIQGELLERHILSSPDVHFLHDLALRYEIEYWAYSVEQRFQSDSFPESIASYDWLKFGFQSDRPEQINRIWNELSKRGDWELTNSDPLNIEVNPKGITKSFGLQKVCDYLEIPSDQVVAIGDSLNDIAMIEWAGFGVAMGNAQQAVKNIADHVTASHVDHGVARCIEFLLQNMKIHK
ncbi:Cof-type HAD-IIB family hydrolase [Fodinisporobacter ferrooxydans]|uniref:Cof-type HAD-IIB family hydrolase n=1 Tax=Fodinisporobacter ferrooxydans TaxID=2901836 RepID=A0ABY4CIW6_9BACL|nr:Cof-type HAD-IIB family hydrolase [Alicyclobacillaceae bacterium MYW30-H2]